MADNIMEKKYFHAQALEQASVTRSMFMNATVYPHWICESDCFWYEQETKAGLQYRLVDAKTANNNEAFDHTVLAQALSQTTDRKVNAENLPISQVKIEISPARVSFKAFGQHWSFDKNKGTCERRSVYPNHWLISPNGKKAAFVRDHNLWLRDIESAEEQALTYDGERHYAYGKMPERRNIASGLYGSKPHEELQGLWSPDSKQLFTFQLDERQVKTLPVTLYAPQDGSLRPRCVHNRVAFPGDIHIAEYRLLSIEVETGHVCEARYPRIPDACMWPGPFSRDSHCAWWGTDCRHAYFIDVARSEQLVRVVKFDTQTGTTRVLFDETSKTYFDLNTYLNNPASLLPLPDSDELIWFSERSGWAHLYLYDLETGELKNPITQGEWLVREVLYFDAKRRDIFIKTAGRVAGRDPYYREVCLVNIDTSEITTLASSEHDYVVHNPGSFSLFTLPFFIARDVDGVAGMSPTGNYFVTTRSRADEAPISELRDRQGNIIMELETADISGLPEGWTWPEPVKLTAADNNTDIYGLVFRPSDFSSAKQYPVIDYVYTNPYLPIVPKGSFTNDNLNGFHYLGAAAYAELGFITVIIDGRGTAFRDKAFHDESYGRMHSASNLADHIAGIQQLAKRYPYMDLNRVGITSMSGDNGPVRGLLEYPDFYRVGTACTTHDIRLSWSSWGERYQGMLPEADYEQSVSGSLADNLQGKLLLIHGMLDHNNHPSAVFQLVEALIQHNKDFDLLLMPNAVHGWNSYGLRRAWDYLVKYLQGNEPPSQFKLKMGIELAMEKLQAK